MRKDLFYAAGKVVVVKDGKQYLNVLDAMSLHNRKFEISCCLCARLATDIAAMVGILVDSTMLRILPAVVNGTSESITG